ncbi:MAG: hypothetical protein HKN87_23905 [Saprospiraceae bacterium]|nr:hypothetical protein [Saprospiraceae bacterium]
MKQSLYKLPIILFCGCILSLTFLNCGDPSDVSSWSEKDLLEYGIPMTLVMPDSAKVNIVEWGIQKDITLVGDDWYNLQLFSARASTHDKKKLKAELLENVQQGRFFSEVTIDEEDGFVFAIQIDTLLNYDFRHVKIQGDQEYIFQAGMSSSYDKDQINQLYQIAKEAY